MARDTKIAWTLAMRRGTGIAAEGQVKQALTRVPLSKAEAAAPSITPGTSGNENSVSTPTPIHKKTN